MDILRQAIFTEKSSEIPGNRQQLWPSASNYADNSKLLQEVFTDYYDWHASQQSSGSVSSCSEQGPNGELWEKSAGLLRGLSHRLQGTSVPWPHPQYLAHMNTDVLLPSTLAYFTTMLYNPNNVTPEASPVTTELEYELSDDFCTLFGFDPKTAWAHLTSGGHAANYEAIWIARNLKYVALAAGGELNPAPADVANILDAARLQGKAPSLLEQAAEWRQRSSVGQGRLLIPANRHYAWDKCADLLGVRLEPIEVDASMRMDMGKLRTKVQTLLREKQPIVAVVATVGSSGEGSVDEIHRILALREECEQQLSASFFLHVDAAFGGYFRSLLIAPPADHDESLADSSAPDPALLLKPEVVDALMALEGVDTITVDPHKCGYVPYPAGCLAIRDRRYSYVVNSQNKYFGQSQQSEYMDFGPYTLEGARPGAATAAVWMAHRLIGLHKKGYGALLSENIATAQRMHRAINQSSDFAVNGTSFHLRSVFEPDLNMLNFLALPVETQADTAQLTTQLSERIIAPGTGYSQTDAPWFSRNRISYSFGHDGRQEISAVRCCVMKCVPEQDFPDFWGELLEKIISRANEHRAE